MVLRCARKLRCNNNNIFLYILGRYALTSMNYLRHFRQSCTAKTVEPPHPFFSVKSQIAINKSVCVSLLLLGPKLRE